MIRGGDFSMLKVWVGLEARSFLQASIETVSNLVFQIEGDPNVFQVERCVKYDQLSPNI
jgi:aarF domain-containing kinase